MYLESKTYLLKCLVFFPIFILLFLGFYNSGKYFEYEIENNWSEPEIFYERSDTSQTSLDTKVYNGEFNGLARHYRLHPPGSTVGDSIDFTRIEYLKIDRNKNIKSTLLADETYPSGLISIHQDNRGVSHFFWSERRIDPEFNEWTREGPRTSGFSTSLFYTSSLKINTIEPAVKLYEEELSSFGRGPINTSVRSDIYNSNNIEAIFQTRVSEQTETVNGSDVIAGQSAIAFLSKNTGKDWSDIVYLDVGHSPDIAVLPNGRIVVAGFGSVPNQVSRNDIFITHSDDGGKTWTERSLVFLSGPDPGVRLRLEASPNGTLHLLWARSREDTILLPEEMWHIHSADGGESWSEPVKFFEIEATPEFPLHHFTGFDSIVDKFGNLHWTTSTLKRNSSMGLSERTLFYSSFNPERERWEQTSIIMDTDFPGGSQLEVDNVPDEIYLIWNDRLNDDLWKVWKYKKKPIQEPEPLPDLPVIAESGPLQLHGNYPNPFNSSTNISFTLLEPGEVELRVYNMSGRRVLRRELGRQTTGRHDHALQMDNLPSGNYLYNLVVDGTHSQQGQMVLVK